LICIVLACIVIVAFKCQINTISRMSIVLLLR
jgi:hypothetical protein